MHNYHFVKAFSPDCNASLYGEHDTLTGTRHKRSVAYFSNLWENASTITISFAENIPIELRDRMEFVIRRWEPFVSLAFEVVADDEGQIRIAVEGNDSYSAMGRSALNALPDDPTMVIGVPAQHPDFDVIILHEFGHALGFNHAHLHPRANIPWNKPEVYKHFGTELGWTVEEITRNLFEVPPSQELLFGDYDKDSIMHYQIPTFLTVGNWQVGANSTLSQGDKNFARKLYPPINYTQLAI